VAQGVRETEAEVKVSVIIPVYNAGKFIDESLASVLMQDWPAHEIILVNDGSTDRDYDLLSRLDARIRILNQTNQGVSAARNRGCAAATAEYVAILDADDVWLPGKLSAQMRHLTRSPEVDAVFCLGLYWTPSADDGSWRQAAPELVIRDLAVDDIVALHYKDFLFTIPVASSSMVVKKSVWQTIGGFDERMKYAEDQDFNLRLSHSHRVDLLKRVGMLYRQHTASATAGVQIPNHWADVTAKTVATLGLADGCGRRVDSGRIRHRLAQLHFFHGYDHFWRGRVDVARREFASAFRKNPLDLKTLSYLTVSVIPGLPSIIKRVRPPRRLTWTIGRANKAGEQYARGILHNDRAGNGDAPRRCQSGP
jgi:glycosyltransferase involved in cell wall biosynthesis